VRIRNADGDWTVAGFRTDAESPAHLSHIGTRTPILANDGLWRPSFQAPVNPMFIE
jgi:hypothetical protein